MATKLVTQVIRSVERRGVVPTVRLAARETARWLREYRARGFDRKYGTDTFGVVYLAGLDVVGANRAHGRQYQPTPRRALEEALASLDLDPATTSFVDLGCGKGRVLLLASLHGFRRVVGVEFARELHEIAVRNVGLFAAKHPEAARIEVLHGDAAEFELPDGDAVYYVFNSFDAELLERIVRRILASCEERPRAVRFIYYNPVHPEVFTRLGVPAEHVRLVPLQGYL